MLGKELESSQKRILDAIEKCQSHVDTENKEYELIVLGLVINKSWIDDWHELEDSISCVFNDNHCVIDFHMEYSMKPLIKYEYWIPIFMNCTMMMKTYMAILQPSTIDYNVEIKCLQDEKEKCRLYRLRQIFDENKNMDVLSIPELNHINPLVLKLDKKTIEVQNLIKEGIDLIQEILNTFQSKLIKLIPKLKHEEFEDLFIAHEKEIIKFKRKELIDSVNNILYQNTGKLSIETNLSDWKVVFDSYFEALKLYSKGENLDSFSNKNAEIKELAGKCIQFYSDYIVNNINPNSLFHLNNGVIIAELFFKPELLSFIDELFISKFRLNYIVTQLYPHLKEEFEKYYDVEIQIYSQSNMTNSLKGNAPKKRGRKVVSLIECISVDCDRKKIIEGIKAKFVELPDGPSKAKYILELRENNVLIKMPSYPVLKNEAGLNVSATAWNGQMKKLSPRKEIIKL